MSQTFACPNCGYQLEAGTPTCGNCGTILQGTSAVPPPLAASGIRPGTVLTLLATLAVAAGLFVARGDIADFFETSTTSVDDVTEGGGNGGGGDVPDEVEIGFRSVGEVVRAIRAGGVPCTSSVVDYSDEILATGSCRSRGSHVQINLYFNPYAFEQAQAFYRDFAFASVHDANWWVSGDTALMARIQKAIGGRLHRPEQ